MEFEKIYTGAIILLMTAALIREIAKPSMILLFALMLLFVGKVITLEETFAGFSNEGMIAVGLLFIIATALKSSTAFENSFHFILGRGKRFKAMQYIRLMFPVAFLSAFFNNTPVVASLIPLIKSWTKKNNLAASKFLIPLSYAAILGGMCTLIGTSTNLLIHGLLIENGMEGFGFFEISKVGAPVAVIVILYFAFGGFRLLPERKDVMVQFKEDTRSFVVVLKVTKKYPQIGKSIENANLRHLQGLFLYQITRKDEIIAPVNPNEKIEENDLLFFTGLPETIWELQKTPGLEIIKDSTFNLKNIDSDKNKTFEAVVSNSSPLAGKTVRESNFRTKYNAVILGIHRNGERINKKVGDIILQNNDTLFILAKKDFDKKWYHSQDFSLVSQSIEEYSKPKKKGNFAFLMLLLLVLVASLGLMHVVVAAAFVVILMIYFRIISFKDAKNTVDFDVLIVIASAFGIGKAIQNSGLAMWMADHFLSVVKQFGPIGIIAALFFMTSIYTEFITNNAAAAIMFPITLAVANQAQIDVLPLIITITIAASASFATPLGYQTNMLVYNPGGYKFKDFLKTGIIMNVLVGIFTTLFVYLFYF